MDDYSYEYEELGDMSGEPLCDSDIKNYDDIRGT